MRRNGGKKLYVLRRQSDGENEGTRVMNSGGEGREVGRKGYGEGRGMGKEGW